MTINNKGVLPALGLGMVAGAALAALAGSKPELKKTAGKAVRTVEEAVEHISDAMGM